MKKAPGKELTPEMLVPRLGEYLVRKKHITEAQLQKALELQNEKQTRRKRLLLGEALLELNYIDRSILDHAITEQIIQLRNALAQANRDLEKRVQERTAELQAAMQKLSELNQLKANFVANISHELRTPLTHVKGYLDLFQMESLGRLTGEQKSAVQVSQRAVGRLENLIDNLILFSQASRGELTLNLTPVNLDEIAKEILDYSRKAAVDRGVDLQTEIPPNLSPVRADAEKVSWAILQLLENAIKFTPSGGRVTLSIHPETATLTMISVSDTGIGIPSNRLEEIFEPFHQLDGSSTRHFGGTGLGLALVRDIVEAHGSVLEVESEAGKGSVFRFPLMMAARPS